MGQQGRLSSIACNLPSCCAKVVFLKSSGWKGRVVYKCPFLVHKRSQSNQPGQG